MAIRTPLVLTLLFTALSMTAQQKLFTLEDLNYGGRNYFSLRPQTMYLTWWGDRLMYQDAEEGGTLGDKGERKVLFTLSDVNGKSKNRIFSAYSAVYPYADKPLVYLESSRGRLLYNFNTREVEWEQATNAAESTSDWNSVSRATAFKRNSQLFVRDAEGNERQLTTDGSRSIVYGESVHRNEFGIEKGLFWSPDGRKLAFYRMDQSMVPDYPQVDIFTREAEHTPDKYPMAGMNTHIVEVGVYDLTTGKTVYMQTPKAEVGADALQDFCYLTNIAWDPESKCVFIEELNRDQNDCRLKMYDAVTGKFQYQLCSEKSDKYVEPLHPIQFLPWDKTLFIRQSQKKGYNHIYLYSIKGEEIKALTSGKWVVMEVLGFNEKTKSVIICSNEKHPLQRNIYAVDVKTGKRTLLDSGEGWHRAELSKTGAQLYDKWSSPTTPNNIDLIKLSSTSRTPSPIHLLQAPDPWAEFVQPIFESGSIKAADGTTDLYWRMVKPHDFDPAKKYPTVVYVYGGPHAHNVDASWHWASRSWETYMAQKGYIVFILDNRGSENRGRDFEQATFRQLGQVEMQDQMKGVDYLRSLPYIDMDRLGVHGWSFGGFMTISLMLNYPDVFKVGVAGGPVIDWQWYEVMYGERYMDTPQKNPEGYKKTSLTAKASNLKGKLQVIIGYNDATVVPQHALSFLASCVEAGTQPDFFVYPGEEHNMRGHASVHLHERITQYFEDYLR